MKAPPIGDSSPEAVGQRLALLRLALGYGERQQRAFADFLSLGATSYNSYETGKQRPPIHVALSIVTRTGASLDWLYRGVEDLLPHHLVLKLRGEDEQHGRKRA
jgi:transcriptional regulator with XRE-family HTH domain